MTYRLAFNPTDSPVIIDDDGRSLAGHDWEALDESNPIVAEAIQAGRLVWPATPDGLAGDGTPAGAALQRAEELNADQTAENGPKKTTAKKG